MRMRVQPGLDDFEVSLQTAGIVHHAGRVTETEGAVEVVVSLGLKESNARIKLSGYVDVLIRHGQNARERGSVSADLSDVGVFSTAQVRVPVAAVWGLRRYVN